MSAMEGQTLAYQVEITNDGDGSGNISVTVDPSGGDEFELLYAVLFNGDTVDRTGLVLIREGESGTNLALGQPLEPVTVTAATRKRIPDSNRRYMVSGSMDLLVQLQAVAASQNARIGLVLRIFGRPPTIAEVGQGTTPTITINTERTE